jgi:acetylornithine deacetylase
MRRSNALDTCEILERLIAFPSVFTEPDYAAITDYAISILEPLGVTCHRLEAPAGGRAGLFAAVGPAGPGGVMLSAHLDVVPTTGQTWRTDPFVATERDGCIYGRGTSDMKGFAAAAIRAMVEAAQRPLVQPLKLALSYDEEAGCVGITEMARSLDRTIGLPDLCIVGEPTSMQIVTGHKGKVSRQVTFTGSAGHSAAAPGHANALHLACDMLGMLRRLQDEVAETGFHAEQYAVPYSTIHVGNLTGGSALNMIPETAVMQFEIRHLAGEDVEALLDHIETAAAEIAEDARKRRPEAGFEIAEFNRYPGFDIASGPATRFLESVGGRFPLGKVDFGTDGGVIAAEGVPVLVCGPGDIARAHKADEFIMRSELSECDAFLDRILDTLEAGLPFKGQTMSS